MRIYLVQHGEANSGDVDPERHLSKKGVAEVKRVAAFLKPIALRVKAVWHSGKARAVETAEILAPALASAPRLRRRDSLAPNDPIGPMKRELAKGAGDVMIVGHLPFLSELASSLVAGKKSRDIVAFQRGGIVCLERDEEGAWRIRWVLIPELLGGE
jgi:phosphohistidine phosphatase